jgi:hypothetical protein
MTDDYLKAIKARSAEFLAEPLDDAVANRSAHDVPELVKEVERLRAALVQAHGSAPPLRPSREADEARGVYVRELSAQETSGDVTATDPAKDRLDE